MIEYGGVYFVIIAEDIYAIQEHERRGYNMGGLYKKNVRLVVSSSGC